MNLDRPLCVIDVEGTGLNTVTDRIISLAIVKCFPDGTREHFYRIFDPKRTIPDEIVRLTGITNEEVDGKPEFKALAAEVRDWLDGCYIVGFNVLGYDLPIIAEEMHRAGVPFKVNFNRVIDSGNIFKKKEERSLKAAVYFYCGRSHDGAHNAMDDAAATGDVLEAQLCRYRDLAEMPLEDLARFSQFERRIDIAGKLARDDEGEAIFNFGHRTRGVRVSDDLGFARWMLNRDFPAETLERLREVIREIYEDAQDDESPPFDPWGDSNEAFIDDDTAIYSAESGVVSDESPYVTEKNEGK